MDPRIAPDFRLLNFTVPLAPWALPLLQAGGRAGYRRQALPPGVEVTWHRVATDAGDLEVEVFGPNGEAGPLPGLVYLHGGAFALEAGPHHRLLAAAYAVGARCRVVSVHYRLAPRFPFPRGLDDAWAALTWAHSQAETLGLAPDRLAVGGDSAGAALAAGLTHRAQAAGAPNLVFQLLVYPVTDASMTTASMAEFTSSPLWNSRLNRQMWKLYLGPRPAPEVQAAASPLAWSTLVGLPPAYLEVAEVDCLKDEGLAYAARLTEAGVPVTLAQPGGTIHGFEVAWTRALTQTIVASRVEALKGALHP